MEKGFLLVFLALLVSNSSLLVTSHSAIPNNITALFSLGDSTLDPGNNDRLHTAMRGDHPPYGREFKGGIATGRFTNGKLVTDMIASILGIKDSVPAYFDPNITNHDLLTGVSFASAGSGLDNRTAIINKVINMSTQLLHFQEYLARIKTMVGNSTASQIIQKAVFVVGASTNDVIFNFYDIPTRRFKYSISAYHDFLLKNLENFVCGLYKNGARKFAITGLPPVGCLPIQVTVAGNIRNRKCVDKQNIDSQAYNAKLKDHVSRWEATLPGTKLVYADIYTPLMDMILNPKKYGFEHTLRACCGSGYIEMIFLCNKKTPVCSNSSQYIFFDSIHPTQAAYQIIANSIQQNVLPILAN